MAYRDKYSKELLKKATGIKAIFCDAEGVLTSGKVLYDEEGRQIRQFHLTDGRILPYLKKAGIVAGVISGSDSETVSKRCAEIKMDFCHQGIIDKVSAIKKLAHHYTIRRKDIVFIGADIHDLTVFRQVGLSVCPADTVDYLKSKADFVTQAKSGAGVFREVADLVLAARGVLEKIVKS